MGKADKEKLGEAPRSVVTPELLAHVYDKTSQSKDIFVRTRTGRIMPATTTDLSPLEIRSAIDGSAISAANKNVPKQNPQRQSEKPSQRDRKPRYNNNSSRRRGR